jgi:flagellar protein FliO/FliZ
VTSSLLLILLFLALLIALAFGARWAQKRNLVGDFGAGATGRIVASMAVGPQQKVVTVEVGPPSNRVWLVLGVTAQSINCLHTMAKEESPAPDASKTSQAPTFNLTR